MLTAQFNMYVASPTSEKAETEPVVSVQPMSLGYRPALDGLRGGCILAVVAFHAGLDSWMGAIGVDIFFVLSGFLITGLFIEEWHNTGRICLKRFYVRRTLRLLPALAALIAALLIFTALTTGNIRAVAPQALAAMGYCMNWLRVSGHFSAGLLNHAWA
jgi:peptidoglycan/LPS O-acetylase OafA/YrhL